MGVQSVFRVMQACLSYLIMAPICLGHFIRYRLFPFKRHPPATHWTWDLDDCITGYQSTLKTCPTGCPGHATTLFKLANTLFARFQQSGDHLDLDIAIEYHRKALTLLPHRNPHRDISYNNLGWTLFVRFQKRRDPIDLNDAILSHQQALDLRLLDHHSRDVSLSNLGNALMARFTTQGSDLADLRRAMACHQEALDIRPPEHRDRAASLSNLAQANFLLFRKLGDRANLITTISLQREALVLRPPGHPDRSTALNHLALALLSHFHQFGDRADLDSAINMHQEVLSLHGPGHPARPMTLTNLGNTTFVRFGQVGEANDLHAAITYYEEALSLCPPGHPGHSMMLNSYSNAVLTRFQRFGDRKDLVKSISSFQDVLTSCPPGTPGRASALNNLAKALVAKFDNASDRSNLDNAIDLYKEALTLRPLGHPLRSITLNLFGKALVTRFRGFGDHTDLEQAVDAYQMALSLCPIGHPERAQQLNNLANTLWSRFSDAGDRADLDTAIAYHQEALTLYPLGHPVRGITVSNLAKVLTGRYNQDGDPADLDKAVILHEEAVGLFPAGSVARSTMLHNLAATILVRFYHRGDTLDLDHAITGHQEALRLRPPGHPDRSGSLSHLADGLVLRFKKAGSFEDLESAVTMYREGLQLRPPGHPDRASSLKALATVLRACLALQERNGHTDNTATDVAAIVSLLKEAGMEQSGRLSVRLASALDWVFFARQKQHGSALEAHRTALELLDTSVTITHSLDAQHARLAEGKKSSGTSIRGLASDAAALAIEQQRPRAAVELLEQGRAILFAQLGRYRTPLEDLRAVDGDLAKEFVELSAQLESAVVATNQTTEGDDVGRYQSLSRRWRHVVDRIRATPGFAGFLQPTSFETLVQAATAGPVIVVNISKYRSDAIILRRDTEPDIVHLRNATPDEVERIAQRLEEALAVLGRERTRRVRDVLQLLWDSVVGPVVERLRNMNVAPGSRIWWCPTAQMCSLPLHAAGIYRDGGAGSRLPDTFISSYTPTLSALIRARREQHRLEEQPGVLVVGVARPAEMDGPDGALASVTPELDQVSKHAPTVKRLEDELATHAAVLQELPNYPWVHLACHGHQDPKNPFDSCFRLQDRPLSLHEIVQARLPNAELAFLSACESAAGDTSAPDEVLHLASALQFVGFRGAIGTLWAMDDVDGPDAAEAFYRYMFREGAVVDFKDAAKGLFHVTKALRQKKVPLDRWVNFVHVGA